MRSSVNKLNIELVSLMVMLPCALPHCAAQPLHFTVLYGFTCQGDGANPSSGLIAAGGTLYGTTQFGGVGGGSTAFSLAPSLAPPWQETNLFSFHGGNGGNVIYSGLTLGADGTLYGTTQVGGTWGKGTVFSLTAPIVTGGPWVESVLHSFGNAADAAYPYAGVVIDTHGVLYGTTLGGGASRQGTVFSITPPQSPGLPWAEAVLYSFTGVAHGGGSAAGPYAGLAIDKGGVLYGTTHYDGAAGHGEVFSLRPPKSPRAAWTQTVLHSFGSIGGALPFAGVLIGDEGVLYGTTTAGGDAGDWGTVYSLTPPASPQETWTEHVLHSFASGADGAIPAAGLIQDPGGVLYGTTTAGGASGRGTVFKLTAPVTKGDGWNLSVLYSFTGGLDGDTPRAPLFLAENGFFYGTTFGGGVFGCGTVFSLRP